MFLGTFSPRLDEKGRLFLPAKFRDELAGGLVITKGQERCLRVFPAAEFTRITERLRDAPMTAKLHPRLPPHDVRRRARRDAGPAGPGHRPAAAARRTPGSSATARSSA